MLGKSTWRSFSQNKTRSKQTRDLVQSCARLNFEERSLAGLRKPMIPVCIECESLHTRARDASRPGY
jgi:hypothetical protein